MSYYNEFEEIRFSSQLSKGEMIDIFYHGVKINSNCLVLETIQDHYFIKGLIIYLNGSSKETIDLENNDGFWVKKL